MVLVRMIDVCGWHHPSPSQFKKIGARYGRGRLPHCRSRSRRIGGGILGRSEGDAGIPAAGISPETAAQLARTAAGWARATLVVAREYSAQTSTLLFDLPGQTDETIILSAHVDGHDVNESAMDNASGVATALAVIGAIAPYVRAWRRGVRLAFFSAEEWH